MKIKTLSQILVLSLAISIVLGAGLEYGFRSYYDNSRKELRDFSLVFFAKMVENENYDKAIDQFKVLKQESSLRSTNLWILDENSQILASSDAQLDLPSDIAQFKKPEAIHQVTAHYLPFYFVPNYFMVKLDLPKPTYVLLGMQPKPLLKHVAVVRMATLFLGMLVSVFVGLLITVVYIRSKSKQAKKILFQIEKGDLKSRFEISTLDEVGSLMLDFNRMADEIERLVHRLQETEESRRDLLRQLGHDLRTPMTSLKTAADTLTAHGPQMSDEERKTFMQIVQAECQYFLRLLEDLFFIAEVDEPKYKKHTDVIDIYSLIQAETNHRASKNSISWQLENTAEHTLILGDKILIQRFIKNAFDNAEKFAQKNIFISLKNIKEHLAVKYLEVLIQDDGPGISKNELEFFGKKRDRRITHDLQISNPHTSLGLGSMIMMSIAKVHGAKLNIKNLKEENPSLGTQIQIIFPVEL